MKKLLALCLLMVCASPALATVYTDATGDLNDGTTGDNFTGFPHLDFAQLEITNTATDITFEFTLVGDIAATNWGKYMIHIDSVAGGDTAGNGWGRPIDMPSGADYWIGTWADGGPTDGGELYDYTGTWNLLDATYNPAPDNEITISKGQFNLAVTVPLANMGLGIGDSFEFDAYSSGGGGTDGAIDSLGNPNVNVTTWGEQSSAHPQTYTVVPEPATLCLLALGGLALIRRR